MSSPSAHNVALGLGSNLNDREALLKEAVERLQCENFLLNRCSAFLDTEPVDCIPGTPRFLNAVVTGIWGGPPETLFTTCKKIETGMGRPKNHSSSESRIIDIDILLFGTQAIKNNKLQIPHPRLKERLFILEPLAEIAPEWRIPPDNVTVLEARDKLLMKS